MKRWWRYILLIALATLSAAPAGAEPVGTMTFAVHVTIATRWLDPAETDAEITPFMIFYALHDALVKPMPASLNAPSLAESWTTSKDGRVWEFVLRKGARFHNGEPVTGEDVKFSFERYRGAAAPIFKERVREVQVVDPGRVRFHLKDPWPDFMTFYGTSASGAAWIVPKKYFEKVGEDGFRRAPIGAGPYKFVSLQPGIELVLEAFDGYWRKTPAVKRLVLRSIPDESTRAAALKRGEVDIAYFLNGPIADDVRRTPGRIVALSEAMEEERAIAGAGSRNLWHPDQAEALGARHRLRTPLHGELRKNVLDVRLHRLGRNAEVTGDFLIGVALAYKFENDMLACTQRFGSHY